MRPWFLFLHRWLGLTVGLVLAFIGLTGSLLVFRPELDARLSSHLLIVSPGAHRARWQAQLEAVQHAHPGHKVAYVFMGRSASESNEWWLDKGALRVYTDPYSGQVLGARTESGSFFPWLHRAHTTLFAGETGEKISGWCGLILASLSLSGIVLWWPRKWNWRRALLPNLRTNPAGKIYEWHRVWGFYIACGLLLSGLTGASLQWPETSGALFRVFGPGPKTAKALVVPQPGPVLSLDEIVTNANAVFPEGQLMRVAFPAKPGAPIIVRKRLPEEMHPNGMNNISLDPWTGQVLQISDSREAAPDARLMNLRYPLHIGLWGGRWSWISRSIAVLVGLTPLLLGATGWLMWLKRARKGRKSVRPGQLSPSPTAPMGETTEVAR